MTYQRRLMARRGEYRIRAAVDNAAITEILLYDEIGEDPWFGTGVSAKTFTQDIAAVETPEIHLRINSPGGDVFEGITMLNALRRSEAKVTVFVDGLAASAASLVAMGGNQVVMSRNSEMMIHDPWAVAIGNADEMQKMADDLNRASDNLASAYADRAGGNIKQWRQAMTAETWYSDKEAVAAGLADRVEPSKTASDKAKARINFDVFAYAGRAAAPDPYLPAQPENPSNKEESDMSDTLTEGLRARLGLAADADETAILAAVDATVAPDDDSEDVDESDETEETDETEEDADGNEATTETVDSDTLKALKRDAEAGRKAYDAQQAAHRESLVSAAVREGKISVARKGDWLNKLAKDPGSESELAALAKGLIPVDGPRGYTGSLSDVAESSDDAIYNALYPEAV